VTNTSGQKYNEKGNTGEIKIKPFMYRNTTNVEHERYDYRVIIGVSGIVTKGLKKNLENIQ
jgi:hypothetical protein